MSKFDLVKLMWYHNKVRWKVRRLSGAPPLSFKGRGKNLKNYRIYGQTVDGESVGDLVTSGDHAGEYKVPVTVSNGTDTLTTPIYLPEQIKKVGDEAEYIDYGEQKQHRVRKNLLQNIAASKTISGVTFTVNADGSVTCNGTNTANSATTFNISTYLLIGTYIINGCPKNGSLGTYSVDLRDPSNWYVLGERDTGLGFTFTNNTVRNVYYAIRINPGYICDNLTFYPMIRKADIADNTYEPYIADTELDVTLPALPTLPGTNTLTVGTEVQPSEVYVEGKIRFIHEGSGENEGE